MIGDKQIEALTHGCAKCGSNFKPDEFCTSGYSMDSLASFEKQIELGIAGQEIRNIWLHVNCGEPKLDSWNMQPDLHVCIKCKKGLESNDVVQPVFRIDNPSVTNPNDPEDVGLTIGDRVYFIHAECDNPGLNKSHGNILLT